MIAQNASMVIVEDSTFETPIAFFKGFSLASSPTRNFLMKKLYIGHKRYANTIPYTNGFSISLSLPKNDPIAADSDSRKHRITTPPSDKNMVFPHFF